MKRNKTLSSDLRSSLVTNDVSVVKDNVRAPGIRYGELFAGEEPNLIEESIGLP